MEGKQAKSIIGIICLLSLFLFFFTPPADSGILDSFKDSKDSFNDVQVEKVVDRGANYDIVRTPEGNFKKTIYAGAINMPDEKGEYKPYTEVTNFTISDNDMIIQWHNKKVTLEFYEKTTDIIDNEILVKEKLKEKALQEISDLEFSSIKEATKGSYYYTHNLTSNLTKQPDAFGYDIITENTTCIAKGYSLICDEQKIDLSQAVHEQGLNVSVTSEGVEFKGDDLSFIDPSVTYNFNSTYQGVNMWAYSCDDSSDAPPANSVSPSCLESIVDRTSDSTLDNSDNSRLTAGGVSGDTRAWILFNASISGIDKSSIVSVNWTFEGDANSGAKAYIYNYSSNSFFQCPTDYGSGEVFGSCTLGSDFVNTSNISTMIFHDPASSFSFTRTDFVSLDIVYDTLIVNEPSNNDEVLNTLQDTLNISTAGYNNSAWYSFSGGKKNYTLCTGDLACTENQTTITYPRQGLFNLTVYANKSDGTETSETVSNIFVGSGNTYNFSSTYASINSFATSGALCNELSLDTTSLSSPLSSCDTVTDISSEAALDVSDDSRYSTGENAGDGETEGAYQIFKFNISELGSEITSLNWSYEGQSSSIFDVDPDFYVWNVSSSNWELFSESPYSSSAVDKLVSFEYVLEGYTPEELINSSQYIHFAAIDTEGIGSGFKNLRVDYSDLFILAQSANSPPTINNLTANSSSFPGLNVSISYNVTDDNEYIENATIFIYNSTGNLVLNLTHENPSLGVNNTFYPNLTYDDTYSYDINATDSDNAVSTLDGYQFIIDTNPPLITIDNPLNNSFYSSSSQTINYTVTDPEGDEDLTSCKWSKDNGATNTTLGSCQNTSDTFAEGSNTIYIWASDNAGNEGFNTSTFTIDLTDPTGQYEAPTESNNSFLSRDNIQINVTGSDTNFDSIEIRLFNSTGSEINTSTTQSSPNFFNITSLSDGTYTFNATINDSANRQVNLPTRTVTVDTTNPLMIIDEPQNQTYTTTSLEINFTATDLNLASCWYSDDNGATNNTLPSCANTTYSANQGSTTLQLYANDSSGKINDSEEVTFFVDSVSPVISIDLPTNNSYSNTVNQDINFTVTETNLDSCWYSNDSMTVNTTLAGCGNLTNIVWTEGQHNVTIYSNDTLNNMGQTSINFTVDSIVPLVTIDNPLNNSFYQSASQTINFSFTDVGSMPDTTSCKWSKDGGATNTTLGTCQNASDTFSEGTNEVIVWASDNAGNEGFNISTFTIDLTNPLALYQSPTESPGSTLNRNNIKVNVSGTDTNLDSIEIRLYNSSHDLINTSVSQTSPYFINFTGLSDGQYFFNASVNDSSGRETLIISRNVTLDTTFPSVTLVIPSNQTYTTTSLEINFTASDANLDTCWYSDDGGATNNTLAGCSNTTYTASQGSTTLRIYANDTAGQINDSEEVTFFVDSIYPEISITTPSNNSFVNSIEQDINFTITETNIDSCWYSNDSMAVNTTLAGCGNLTSINWTEGPHNVSIWINDTLGQENQSSVSFTVDTISPTGSITNIATVNGSQTVKFNHTASDTNIDSCFYSVTNTTNGIDNSLNNASITCGANDTQFTTTAFSSYNLTFYVNDSAGNLNWSRTNFLIQNITIPAGGGGGGGGGGEDILIVLGNATWTMKTEKDGDRRHLEMAVLAKKSEDIIFKNDGAEEINLSLNCSGDLCGFLTLSSNNITLPVGIDVPTIVVAEVTIPQGATEQLYLGNIIATDQYGISQLITISSRVSGLGYSFLIADKLRSAKRFGEVPIPYIFIYAFFWAMFSVLSYYIGIKRIHGGEAISVLVGLVTGLIPIVFI